MGYQSRERRRRLAIRRKYEKVLNAATGNRRPTVEESAAMHPRPPKYEWIRKSPRPSESPPRNVPPMQMSDLMERFETARPSLTVYKTAKGRIGVQSIYTGKINRGKKKGKSRDRGIPIGATRLALVHNVSPKHALIAAKVRFGGKRETR